VPRQCSQICLVGKLAIDTVAASLPHIRSGALRPLAVTTAARLDALPHVPTVGETLADYEVAWTGIGAPKGTPPAIVEKLNREINSGLTNLNISRRRKVGSSH
jgi:tripartite-type tricarboxylate transporter receptor subunit TctC